MEDTDDARAAADVLGVRHYVINLEREFKDNVVDKFVAEYARGRTPNPCLACNDHVKFRPLLEHAIALGAEWLATGHYARVRHADAGAELHRADPGKDQSYVLYTLGQAELSRTLFPCGEFAKDDIRRRARKYGPAGRRRSPDSSTSASSPAATTAPSSATASRWRPVTSSIQRGAPSASTRASRLHRPDSAEGMFPRGVEQPLFVVDIDMGRTEWSSARTKT